MRQWFNRFLYGNTYGRIMCNKVFSTVFFISVGAPERTFKFVLAVDGSGPLSFDDCLKHTTLQNQNTALQRL